MIGHSSLERRPVVFQGSTVYLLLPTAVGPAIARLVIEWAVSDGKADVFEMALAHEYAALFENTPLLGVRSGAELTFQRISGGRIAALMKEIDPGRFLI